MSSFIYCEREPEIKITASSSRDQKPALDDSPKLPLRHRRSLVKALAAVILQLAVIALLITVVFVDLYIQRMGTLPTIYHSIYITVLVILATTIVRYTTGQITNLWVQHIASHRNGSDIVPQRQQEIEVLIGLSSFRDQVKLWRVSSSFIITGLVTTAIVAGITPSSFPGQVVLQPQAVINTNHKDKFRTGCLSISLNTTAGWLSWPLGDGWFISTNPSACDDQTWIQSGLQGMVDTPIFVGPISFAYAVGGIPVDKLAVGAPWVSRSGFDQTFGIESLSLGFTYGFFQSASQCFPVVMSNPVQCRATGSVTVGQNKLSVEAAGCNISTSIFSVNPETQGASSAGACANNSGVGKATIVIGSTNSHASSLASAMEDKSYTQTAGQFSSYAVACDVNFEQTISFRRVTYGRNDNMVALYAGQSSIAVFADSQSPCIPESRNGEVSAGIPQIANDATLASAMAGLYPLLTENTYRDGSLDLLWSLTNRGVLAFNNSRHPLEDSLGLGIAFGLSLAWGSSIIGTGKPEHGINITGTAIYTGVRVGNGQWWAIIYILPSVYAVALLGYLLWKTRKN